MRKLLLIGLLAGALAAGCASGTKHPSPPTPVPESTVATVPTTTASTTTSVPPPQVIHPAPVTLPHTD